jgi:hypothetical protein
MVTRSIKIRDASLHLFLLFGFIFWMLLGNNVQAQERVKIQPELGFGYRHSYLPIVYGPDNLYMWFNSDKNIRGINASVGFKVIHFPTSNLSFRYRLHVRYDYLMDDIDYLNLMPTFGRGLIVFEKWGWLFDHRIGLYKTFRDRWDIGLGFTCFNAGMKNKQNLPPDNSKKWVYSIQTNCIDLIVYRKIKNWFDVGLISSFTIAGLPDHKDGNYIIFELQISRSFNLSKDE